jgi:hypothetical protein
MDGGTSSIGTGITVSTGLGFGARLRAGFVTTAFAALARFFGAVFLEAVFFEAAFLATFALTVFLAFPFAFIGRTCVFAALFLADAPLAFAIGRFFDLLFFAMVTLLLKIVQTRCESSPEKVCCHLCVTLESADGIA